jgi:hypothetical protein
LRRAAIADRGRFRNSLAKIAASKQLIGTLSKALVDAASFIGFRYLERLI